ncbi:bone morphogenetic protein 15 isoform X2 [Esox lucius]|uniref:bone morphogenetic protein 15 isoform X2 n=1 Tax=Esox lucius TaxID=8010 RepID=UPI00057719AA|nr:bone morphogenetic protein 15 isoform X2 [Esox lucius]
MKLVPELNMRTTRRSHRYSLYNICVLSFFFFLLCSTFNRAGGDMTAIHTSPSASSQSKFSGRTRRHNHNVRHKMQQESHHRPLTEVQKADQNLQYMLSLYKSAADPDGRPKHHRKFGSNTVRLLRPSTTKMRSLTASTDLLWVRTRWDSLCCPRASPCASPLCITTVNLRYTYTVEYDLHPLTLDQLVRASFVHLRSSSTPHRSPLRCRVRVTSPGNDSWTNLPVGLEDQRRLVTLESHQQWIETDITEHLASQMVTQEGPKQGNRLSLSAQYWCLDPWYRQSEGWDGVLRFRTRGRHVSRRAASGNHLNAPALLLFFDEEEEPREWGATSRTAASSLGLGGLGLPDLHRTRARFRRSEALPFIPSGRKPPGSIVSDIPDYSGAPNSSPKNQCKLYSYRVTFAALGMAHYVAPPQYNPHYCKGDCPRVLHYGLNPSNHAIMQTMIKGKGVAEVPSPSCVPYRYKPMSVLVLLEDNKTVDYKEIEDMIAESCTCR